jgi:hypothetical protein
VNPVADPPSATDIGISGDRLDPADRAVLFDLEIRGDVILPDDQALLPKAGEQVKFEQARGEVVGLQVGDEVRVRVGER